MKFDGFSIHHSIFTPPLFLALSLAGKYSLFFSTRISMDRMKDSGSFDAGSTPAGCTLVITWLGWALSFKP